MRLAVGAVPRVLVFEEFLFKGEVHAVAEGDARRRRNIILDHIILERGRKRSKSREKSKKKDQKVKKWVPNRHENGTKWTESNRKRYQTNNKVD